MKANKEEIRKTKKKKGTNNKTKKKKQGTVALWSAHRLCELGDPGSNPGVCGYLFCVLFIVNHKIIVKHVSLTLQIIHINKLC